MYLQSIEDDLFAIFRYCLFVEIHARFKLAANFTVMDY